MKIAEKNKFIKLNWDNKKNRELIERCKNKKLGIAFKIVPLRFSRTNVFVNMRLGTKVSSFFNSIGGKNVSFRSWI